MNTADLLAISPILALAATSVGVMLAVVLCRHRGVPCLVTLVGLGTSAAALRLAWPLAPRHVTPLLLIDGAALF